jgi:hypothetical protein
LWIKLHSGVVVLGNSLWFIKGVCYSLTENIFTFCVWKMALIFRQPQCVHTFTHKRFSMSDIWHLSLDSFNVYMLNRFSVSLHMTLITSWPGHMHSIIYTRLPIEFSMGPCPCLFFAESRIFSNTNEQVGVAVRFWTSVGGTHFKSCIRYWIFWHLICSFSPTGWILWLTVSFAFTSILSILFCSILFYSIKEFL